MRFARARLSIIDCTLIFAHHSRVDAELLCPACRIPLTEMRTGNSIIWRCEKCDGRAVGLQLLRRTFTSESINPLWLHAIYNEGSTARPCPSWGNAMIEVALDCSSGMRVEVCRICEFVWFDAGETQSLQARPLPKPAAPLPQKVRETIALAKVQQLAEQARGPDFDSAPPDEWWKSIAAFFGMPAEFDAPAQERRPVVTWFLAGVIVTASVHAFFHLQEAVQLFGLIPAQAFRLHGLTFVTSFFLHAGVIHLVGNMYFLLVFGDDVENFLGPLRYIALIVIAAFVGDVVHIASAPNSTLPCIGASGGIAGVITFYALAFPQAKIGFLWRYFYYFRWIRLPAWFVFILWIVFQIIGAYEQKAGISSVSSFAHLGGAAVGFLAWLLCKKSTRLAQA
jgi:membrane associated rhomboid family serine protease/Zn-finger nucleic acid-binding protein